MTNITTPTPARAAAPREAVRPAVACATWSDTGARDHVCTPDDSFAERPALAIDGTAADIRERIRAALARTDLVPIQNVEGITDIVTRALGVQP